MPTTRGRSRNSCASDCSQNANIEPIVINEMSKMFRMIYFRLMIKDAPRWLYLIFRGVNAVNDCVSPARDWLKLSRIGIAPTQDSILFIVSVWVSGNLSLSTPPISTAILLHKPLEATNNLRSNRLAFSHFLS